jgi:nucleoside-diphosphate-sugar epimerase
MRVLITGVTGNVGKIAAKRLAEAGAEVVGFARHEADIPGVSEFRVGSVTDYDTLIGAMLDCHAVLHLAAYHMPYDAPEEELYNVNAGGTFNVFRACAELGLGRVTVASSPNAIGYNFGVRVQDLSYLPIDGAHPSYTSDPYSFTKWSGEEIGRYFYRRYGISSVFMRLGLDFKTTIDEWVVSPSRDKARSLHQLVLSLLRMPAKERAREVRRIENEMDERRLYAMTDALPYKNGIEYVYESFSEEQKIWCYLVHNFLMYLDSRDLADAILCAINAEFEGSHDIFIADHKNLLGIESLKLARLLYPGAKVDANHLQGYDALVDYREAEKLIGFRAKHTVADYYGALYD